MAPTYDGVIVAPSAELARYASFWGCVEDLERPPRVRVRVVSGCSPAENRNLGIAYAQAVGARWIWFLDDDLTFQPDTLLRLLARFESEQLDVLVPLTFMRKPPFAAIWFSRPDPTPDALITALPPPGQLVRIQGATFGGMLLRLSALEGVEPPYVAIGQAGQLDRWDDDVYFCRKLLDAGVAMWGDTTVRMGHTANIDIWPYFDAATQTWAVVFARHQQPFFAAPWQGAPDIVTTEREGIPV